MNWLASNAGADREENLGGTKNLPSLGSDNSLDIGQAVQVRGMVRCVNGCIEFGVLLEEFRTVQQSLLGRWRPTDGHSRGRRCTDP